VKKKTRPSKGGPAENLCFQSEKLTLICSVIWAWSETVCLHNWQIVIKPRKTKTCVTRSGPGPPSGIQDPGKFYRLLPPLDGAKYFGQLSCSVLFIKFEGWVECSLQPDPGPYAKPVQFLALPRTLFKIHIYIINQSTPWSPMCLSYYQVQSLSYQFSHARIFIVVNSHEVRPRVGHTWHAEHPTLPSVWALIKGNLINDWGACIL